LFDVFFLKIDDDRFELFEGIFRIIGFKPELKKVVEIPREFLITGETLRRS
jgi:hypothetical protein